MKKSPHSLGHALAATCLVLFSAVTITGALAQTPAPAGLQVQPGGLQVQPGGLQVQPG